MSKREKPKWQSIDHFFTKENQRANQDWVSRDTGNWYTSLWVVAATR
jgi:hypothetical protein